MFGSGNEPFYSLRAQDDIVLAACILHNYLMGVDPDMELIEEVNRELLLMNQTVVTFQTQQVRVEKWKISETT